MRGHSPGIGFGLCMLLIGCLGEARQQVVDRAPRPELSASSAMQSPQEEMTYFTTANTAFADLGEVSEIFQIDATLSNGERRERIRKIVKTPEGLEHPKLYCRITGNLSGAAAAGAYLELRLDVAGMEPRTETWQVVVLATHRMHFPEGTAAGTPVILELSGRLPETLNSESLELRLLRPVDALEADLNVQLIELFWSEGDTPASAPPAL